MRSIGLLFKVLWSPGEAMFFLSKNPRVLVPMAFLALFSLGTGTAVLMNVGAGELAMRAIERSPQGRSLSEEQKAVIRRGANSPFVKGLTFVSSGVGPLIVILIVATLYYVLAGKPPYAGAVGTVAVAKVAAGEPLDFA